MCIVIVSHEVICYGRIRALDRWAFLDNISLVN